MKYIFLNIYLIIKNNVGAMPENNQVSQKLHPVFWNTDFFETFSNSQALNKSITVTDGNNKFVTMHLHNYSNINN